MPTDLPQDAVDAAQAAVAFAQQVRKYHAKRSEVSSPQRKEDIKRALSRLREAMLPLRSEIGRFPYGPQTTLAEQNREVIRQLSDAMQRERRKLWKMQKPKRVKRRK